MSESSKNLMRCPFCGGTPELNHMGRHYGVSCANWKCQGMQGALMHLDENSAVDAWNSRVPDGNGNDPFGWVKPAGGNYFTRSALSARRIGGLVPVYAAPVADSAMAKDAERYRWLRNIKNMSAQELVEMYHGKKLDDIIDAAIAASGAKKSPEPQ